MTKSPHFWWLFCTMVLVIVALSAFCICNCIIHSEILVNYISVSSLILSITLSIIAIQYTYTSNTEISHQFEKINNAAERIKDTADNLISTSSKIDENFNKILDNLNKIDESQRDLAAQVGNMNNPIVNEKLTNYKNKDKE